MINNRWGYWKHDLS